VWAGANVNDFTLARANLSTGELYTENYWLLSLGLGVLDYRSRWPELHGYRLNVGYADDYRAVDSSPGRCTAPMQAGLLRPDQPGIGSLSDDPLRPPTLLSTFAATFYEDGEV
jgi:hypothetical protein